MARTKGSVDKQLDKCLEYQYLIIVQNSHHNYCVMMYNNKILRNGKIRVCQNLV